MSAIRKRVGRMEEGCVLTYQNFKDLDQITAVALALSRLRKEGLIERLQKGVYYIPRKTNFGLLEPSDSEILKALVGKNGYISGVFAYNKLGLTTQVPNEVTIKCGKFSRQSRVGKLRIKYARNKLNHISSSPELLQILDAFNDIKRIPDSKAEISFEKLSSLIQQMGVEKQRLLAKLALHYKPSVRAMVGAILQTVDRSLAEKLKSSLNPITTFKIGLNHQQFPALLEWRIR